MNMPDILKNYHAADRRLQATVEIDYTNWRGERRSRKIVPLRIEFGSNEWHKEPQWILMAYDDERGGLPRGFAMSGIHSWKQPNNKK